MNFHRLGLLIFMAVLLGPISTFGSLDRRWREIKTPHFRILYDADHKQTALLYARQAERARTTLLQLYSYAPETTVIFLDDSTDLANGMATSLPYPYLRIFPVFPSTLDSIGDYENWAFELLVHEYAHLLTFEPSLGIFRPMRWVFGSVARPNFLLPRWYHEGWSVFWESYFSSSGGRLRSAAQQGNLRTLALSPGLYDESISRWNEILPDWMGGQRAYLLGGVLAHHLYTLSDDPGVLPELTYDYAARIPYTLDGPVRRRWGMGFGTLSEQVLKKLERDARAQQKTISVAGGISGQLAPEQKGVEWRSPKFSPDGKWLAAVQQDASFQYKISFFKVTPHGLEPAHLKFPSDKKIVSLDWDPSSEKIVFDRLTSHKREGLFFDLYEYDLSTQRIKRLTRGLRATEPAISPSGDQIAFRQNYGSGSRLAITDRNGKGLQVLHTPPAVHRVSGPEFLNERHLVFTERGLDGKEKLFRTTLSSNSAPVEMHADYAPLYSPRSTPAGLLFRSEVSGVPNLYLADAQGEVRAVTNSITRVLDGDLHPFTGELAYSEATEDGLRLKLLESSQVQRQPRRPPQVEPLVAMPPAGEVAPASLEPVEERAYRPLRYMLPRYWMPFVFFQEEGFTVQAVTSGHDPSLRHMYSLQASYDNLSNKIGALGAYTYAPGSSTWSLVGGKVYEYILSGGFVRSVDLAKALTTFYIPGLSDNFRGQLGLMRSRISYGDVELLRAGPEVGLNYQNITQGPGRVTPEKGAASSLTYAKYLENWGALTYEQWNLQSSLYHSRWLPEGHGVALHARGQYAPSLNHLLLGGSNLGGAYQFSLVSGSFLTRGYPTGTFLGRSIINASLEYRLPLSSPHRGWGTTPLFLKRTHLNFFIDTLAVDGLAYNFRSPSPQFDRVLTDQFFSSAGLEYKWDMTLGYMAPVQVFLGAYYGFDQDYGGGFTPFLGLLF